MRHGVPAVPLERFAQGTQTAIAAPGGDRTLVKAYAIFASFVCTHYQHVYEVTDRYVYADCVGWTANLTRLADPRAWASLVARTGLRPGYVPSPGHFRRFFAGLVSKPAAGWAAVGSLRSIRAGDILAWTPEAANGDTTGTSLAGHSVLVISNPVPVAGRRNAYYVVVMDSTATPHGPYDTRHQLANGEPAYPWGDRNAPLGWSAEPGKSPAGRLSGLGIGTVELVGGTTLASSRLYWSPPSTQGARAERVTLGAGRPLS